MPKPSKRLIVVCPILPNPITPTVACAGEDSLSYAAAWGVGNAKARPEEAERADARFAVRFRTAAAGSTASRATCPPRLLGCPVGRGKREQTISSLVECCLCERRNLLLLLSESPSGRASHRRRRWHPSRRPELYVWGPRLISHPVLPPKRAARPIKRRLRGRTGSETDIALLQSFGIDVVVSCRHGRDDFKRRAGCRGGLSGVI